jgi:hypothetical protein
MSGFILLAECTAVHQQHGKHHEGARRRGHQAHQDPCVAAAGFS